VQRDELSYCRICAAACGIVVTVDDNRVLRVRGDEDHPVSRGYTCSKGRGLAAWHHSPRRLDRPRLHGRDVSWDELIADLAERLSGIIEANGPDAVALYLATGLAYDAAGQIAASRWLPSIGSRSFLTAVTVDNAPALVAAELVTGEPMLNPVWDPNVAGLTIFVGTNPVVSHGYGTALPDPIRYIREYRARGGRVWVLDPRRTETAARADVHVPVLPGADMAVLAAVANALFESGADERELNEHCDAAEVAALRTALGGFTVERAAATADVDPALLEELVAEVRAHRGRIAMHCGTGVTMSRDGVLAEWLRWVVLIASGSLDRATGMHFHRGVVHRLRRRPPRPGAPDSPSPRSRPELPRVVGQIPAVALVDEIESGNIRALFITGGNPLTAFPQPDRLEAALKKLDVLAVVDVAANRLSDIATHVLPATGQLERSDITLAELTALRSGIQATPAIVEPGADRRPVWWMFAALSRAMGRAPAEAVDPNQLRDEDYLRGVLAHSRLDADEVFAAGPRGIETPVEHGWVRAELLPDGRWSIAPRALLDRLAAYVDPAPGAFVFAPRREMAWSNSIAYGPVAVGPVVRMNPAGVRAEDETEAGIVTVATDHGTVTAAFAPDPAVRDGVVSMTHGHADANPGNLTSGDVAVDRLTGMPRVAGLEIRVTRLDEDAKERGPQVPD
jgi:anaerobic selenocysteine-containing dehydrogenase